MKLSIGEMQTVDRYPVASFFSLDYAARCNNVFRGNAGFVHTFIHKRDAASSRQIKINDAFNIWLVRMQ